MKTKKINVDLYHPASMFEDPELVGKIISVRDGISLPQEYLVIGKSNEENEIGLKLAAVIRWSPIISGGIEAFTAESLQGAPLHFALLEYVSKGSSNYESYQKQLQIVKPQ